MLLGAAVLQRDVLVERAAEGHVDQLQAAADAEHRLAARNESLKKIDLVEVTHAISGPLCPERRLAVGERAHVRAALQHEPVELGNIIFGADVAAPQQAPALDRGQHEHQRVERHQPMRNRLLEVLQGLAPEPELTRHVVKETR